MSTESASTAVRRSHIGLNYVSILKNKDIRKTNKHPGQLRSNNEINEISASKT